MQFWRFAHKGVVSYENGTLFFAPQKKLGFKCSKHVFLMWILLSILQNNIKLGDCYNDAQREGAA